VKKQEFAYVKHEITEFVDGKWIARRVNTYRVRVMTRVEGYAMVRRPGCVPFIMIERELLPDSENA
jgi:hypothetical protein